MKVLKIELAKKYEIEITTNDSLKQISKVIINDIKFIIKICNFIVYFFRALLKNAL
jgi:hypothetical protein